MRLVRYQETIACEICNEEKPCKKNEEGTLVCRDCHQEAEDNCEHEDTDGGYCVSCNKYISRFREFEAYAD